MAAGDKEIILASEEVQRRNITAILDHGNQTRVLVRDLEAKVDQMQRQIMLQDQKIVEMRSLLSNVQAKLYQGGSK